MKGKLNILLTGASGTVGLQVLNQLYQKKHLFNITVFDIKTKKTKKVFKAFKKEIDVIYGSIVKNNELQKACINKDVVIHLAAIIPPLADDNPEKAFNVNVKGTENLIRNLEQFSPKAFVVYSSSISVYGDRLKNPLIKVDDVLMPSLGDEYAKTKIEAEKIISNSKLDWSIFRLSAIMGGHKISKLMFHQPLDTSLEIATPEDTARAFVNAIDNKVSLIKKVFNLGGGEKCRITYNDFLVKSFSISGLGAFDFPEKTFAEKNFHCGFYVDGVDLEKILHFRNDDLESYFEKERSKISIVQKVLIYFFHNKIKKRLLQESEPRNAFLINDKEMINRFFVKPLAMN